jgi:hypothetical protein
MKMEQRKYDIKGMTVNGRELLAWMGNSFGICGGAWLDEKNVHNLTDKAIEGIVFMLWTMKNLPPDKEKDKQLVLKELGNGLWEDNE